MNKKGFTLVELLATIIILGMLALLASTSVTKVLKESKGDLYTTQIKLVESGAKAWGAENIDKLPDDNECKYLTIKNLQDYGLIDENITNPKTGEKIDNNIKIKISSKLTGYGNSVTNYEVDPESVDGCSRAMPCTLISGEANTIGAKYECEVSPGTKYNFYVLSYEDDGTTNLIMDRNICEDGTPTDANKDDKCTEYWHGTNAYGPITAMDYLYNATKDWSNIPNIEMNYTDEGNTGNCGYGTIVTTDNITKITKKDRTVVTVLTDKEGYSNLKARLPRYDEVHGEGKCLTYFENGNKHGSCPLWLLNYLDSSSYVTGEGLQNISGIYGYWTLSSYASSSYDAWYVHNYGSVTSTNADLGGYIGVRAVINLKL